jgi:hypothetical protein
MKICPISPEWIHNHLVEPYLQGVELVNQAWKGETRSLLPQPLSLAERVICWIQGTFLLLPFVNTIIWLAWQTFGTPEKLADPYYPEKEPAPALLFIPPAQQIVEPNERPQQIERLTYRQTIGDKAPFPIQWEIKHYPNTVLVEQNGPDFTTSSIYRPEDLSLRNYSYTMGAKQFHLQQGDADRHHVHVQANHEGAEPIQKTFELEEQIPLIQQRTLGFKHFILSEANELYFYAIVPEIPLINHIPLIPKPPFLMKCQATKTGLEDGLLKMEVTSTWRWPFSMFISEMWFDPATGLLQKSHDKGPGVRILGELVPNHPLPVQERL